MEFFGFARKEGFPTQYPENKTPVTEDVLELGFIAAFIIVIVAFYSIVLGFNVKNGISFATRVTISATIGLLIMLGNFGQEWEVGGVHSKTAYKAGTKYEIDADIGIKVGLRSVNVTLKADTQNVENELKGEIINYNERFEWTWDQGRFGFGPYAGLLQREFRAAQRRGLPLPILWIVDYLVVDGEGLRFGRYYRTAGWYAHISAWTALPCWMMANLLFLSVVQYGAIMTAVTGIFQLLACLLWVSIRNPFELVIPFEEGDIRTHFGSSFWVTFSSGILCLLISLIVIILDLRFPNEIVSFFGVDPLSAYEETSMSRNAMLEMRHPRRGRDRTDTEMEPINEYRSDDNRMVSVLKRRSMLRYAQKNLVKHERMADVAPEKNRAFNREPKEGFINKNGSEVTEAAKRPLPAVPPAPHGRGFQRRENREADDSRIRPGPSNLHRMQRPIEEALPEYTN